MKFIAEANVLSSALKKVAGVVETKSTIPVLTHIKITASKPGRVTLEGTDLDLEIRVEMDAQVEVAGGITAAAHMLESYVAKLPKGSQVQVALEDTRLSCRAGRSSIKIHTLPVDDYPTFEAGEMPYHFNLAAKDLARLMNDVRYAMSTEETRYYLNGAYLHAHRNGAGVEGIAFCATDGHRLSISHMPMNGVSGFPGIIVPRKTMLVLLKLCEGARDVTVAYSQMKISVDYGDTRLISKLIDGTYPDYERVIPRGENAIASIGRADLMATVDRVSTVSKEKGRAMKLEFGAGRLVVAMNDPDSGSAVEDMDITYEATPTSIGFNARYIADVLNSFDAKSLDFAITDPGSPVRIFVNGDPNRLSVLMPMRV